MAKQILSTVSFRCDIETALPHPEEMTITTFLGRANLTFDLGGDPDYQECTAIEITDLWMGIDIPEKWKTSDFRVVSTPTVGAWAKTAPVLLSELEQAAIDQYRNPVPVTLPDEVTPIKHRCLIELTPASMFRSERFFAG